MRGQAEVAPQKAEGDGGCRERPEQMPGEMPGAREIDGGDRRNQDVQDQRGRLEGGGSKAEKGQDGDLPGCPAVADAGVEDRHHEEADRENEEQGNAHGRTSGQSSMETTTVSPEARAVPGAILMNPLAAVRDDRRAEL